MSAFGDAVNAVRQVILLHARIETLDERITAVADDLDGLADLIGSLRDRVSRLEGFLEGAAAVSKPRLPRK